MPRRVRKSKRRRSTLTVGELFELSIGPNVLRRGGLRREVIDGWECFSVFESDAARRRAWLLHRDALLASASRSTLPWAWHRYEGGDPPEWVPEEEAGVELSPVAGEVDELLSFDDLDDESRHDAT